MVPQANFLLKNPQKWVKTITNFAILLTANGAAGEFFTQKTYKTGLKKNNHKFSYFIDSKWRRRRIFYSKTLKNGLKLFQKFQVCGRETGIFLPPLIESGRAAAPPAPPAATALPYRVGSELQ